MSEDKGPDSLDAHVRRLMKDLGLRGFHVERSKNTDDDRTNVSCNGYPDWTICGAPGKGVVIRELKSEKGRLSAAQQEWIGDLKAAGADVGVWRPSDLLSGRVAQELTAISRFARSAA